jgi:hypothetical protein
MWAPPIFRPLNKAGIEQAGWQVQQLAQAKAMQTA